MADSNTTREQAEVKFAKMQAAAREAAKASAEYDAAGTALRQRTAQLKELRIAKEAVDLQEAAAKPKKAPARKRVAKKA